MSKRQIRILLVIMQVLLAGMQFLPVGQAFAPGLSSKLSLSVFGMMHRYAGMGFSNDALVYLILSGLLPVLTTLFLFLLKERYNFGVAACLSAFYALAAACFFSAARRKMVDYVSMTGLHYMIVFVAVLSMGFAIGGFCISTPSAGNGETDGI